MHHLHHLEGKLCQENSKNQNSSPETACNQEAIAENPVQAKENPPPSGASGANSLPASVLSGTEVVQDVPSSGAIGSKPSIAEVPNQQGIQPPSNPRQTPAQSPSSATATAQEFAEQIRKAIANLDRSLAIKIWNALAGKTKTDLRDEVKNCLATSESNNFKLLAKAGFIKGTKVRYIGTRFSEQYQGVVLRVSSMDEYFEISCLKPDGSGYTTRLKPEELEIIR